MGVVGWHATPHALSTDMNTYVISPNVVRVKVDQQLSESFAALDKRLRWRPLTTNLDSCEEAPYMYFRINLELRHEGGTFAGFATGAPFLLTRNVDVQKRAFFLRHWVRKVPEHEHKDAPITPQPHMAIGAQSNRLLIRVDIDRRIDPKDTFKSVPFATCMFQVVQVDAIIHEIPHVRLAFAIERTPTVEERDYIGGQDTSTSKPTSSSNGTTPSRPDSSVQRQPASGSSTSTPPSVLRKAAAPLAQQGSPVAPLHRPVQPAPVYAPASQQSVMYKRIPMLAGVQAQHHQIRQTLAPARPLPPPGVIQHNPYNFVSARNVPMQMRQVVPIRPPSVIPIPPPTVRPVPRTYVRHPPNPPVAAPPPVVAVPVNTVVPTHYLNATEHSKANTHPDVRLWEEHNIHNPYEPIFVTEDAKFQARAKKTVLLDICEAGDEPMQHENLFGLAATGHTSLHLDGMAAGGKGDEPDIEVVVQKRKRPVVEGSEVSEANRETVATKKYSASIMAAADYNRSLGEERKHVKRWIEEDAERADDESEDDEDDDDASVSE